MHAYAIPELMDFTRLFLFQNIDSCVKLYAKLKKTELNDDMKELDMEVIGQGG